MKALIMKDELYPFYNLTDSKTYAHAIKDMDGRVIVKWRRVMKEFWAIQEEMARMAGDEDYEGQT